MLQPPIFSERETSLTLKIITRGRLTGLPHIAELRFAYLNNAIYVVAGNSNSDWVLNALGATTAVKVKIAQTIYPVAAKLGSSFEREQVLAKFRRKYGARIVDQWYRGAQLCVRLDLAGVPVIRGTIGGEASTQADFSDWKSVGTPYLEAVEQAFDSASEEYDYTISRNYINTWIRERSIHELIQLTHPSDLLLEIGCGTGTEAIRISNYVAGIVATDISQRMLETLEKKIRAKKLEHKISTTRVAASQIDSVQSSLPDGKVRIAYSFNGALNCEPEIKKVPEKLSRIIRPGGYFVCSIRNTICLSEVLSHSLALQFSKLAPRKNQPVMVSVGGKDIPSYYYPPGKFLDFFEPYFKVKRLVGLPALLPPAYLNDYYLRAGRLMPFIERLESLVGPRFPFNNFGDQTLLVLQRRD